MLLLVIFEDESGQYSPVLVGRKYLSWKNIYLNKSNLTKPLTSQLCIQPTHYFKNSSLYKISGIYSVPILSVFLKCHVTCWLVNNISTGQYFDVSSYIVKVFYNSSRNRRVSTFFKLFLIFPNCHNCHSWVSLAKEISMIS